MCAYTARMHRFCARASFFFGGLTGLVRPEVGRG
jgi:hypothetical protein